MIIIPYNPERAGRRSGPCRTVPASGTRPLVDGPAHLTGMEHILVEERKIRGLKNPAVSLREDVRKSSDPPSPPPEKWLARSNKNLKANEDFYLYIPSLLPRTGSVDGAMPKAGSPDSPSAQTGMINKKVTKYANC